MPGGNPPVHTQDAEASDEEPGFDPFSDSIPSSLGSQLAARLRARATAPVNELNDMLHIGLTHGHDVLVPLGARVLSLPNAAASFVIQNPEFMTGLAIRYLTTSLGPAPSQGTALHGYTEVMSVVENNNLFGHQETEQYY